MGFIWYHLGYRSLLPILNAYCPALNAVKPDETRNEKKNKKEYWGEMGL
jgi:hypothetical protein